MNEQPLGGRGRGPSPILVIGIIIFVLPFFSSVIHKNIPGWLSIVGTILILIGALLSIMNQSK